MNQDVQRELKVATVADGMKKMASKQARRFTSGARQRRESSTPEQLTPLR